MSQKMRIVLMSFDVKALEKSTRDIVSTLRMAGAGISGPFPLPAAKHIVTVNRSPHVNKKSREQFQIKTMKRLVLIHRATSQVVDLLRKVDLSCGVDVAIELN
jgi:small subunit ribosomal protein S10